MDPVEAYDLIAPEYARLSEQRRAYLDAIERIVISEIPRGSRSMLDVGAGDGARANRIARAAGCSDLWLLEPSASMRKRFPTGATVLPIRAEDLGSVDRGFDAITCLWNVLGHIFPASSRIEVLRHFARLARPNGRIFVDINHRYNASHYGAIQTALRLLRDCVLPNEHNGDVRVTWQTERGRCTTAGHVFTQREMGALVQDAGLQIVKRYAVNYATGAERRWAFQGNLLYVMRAR